MRVKTNELTGAALDWAVAKCEGLLAFGYRKTDRFIIELSDGEFEEFCPSTDWAQGGPIIEREKITIFQTGRDWMGYIRHDTESFAPTPLIAAMRCYVASKLGDEVEIPEELV
jgi:hypothetical protein